MMTKRFFTALCVGALLFASLQGCASKSGQESTGEYLDSTVISGKVRANILADKEVSIFKIDVTTYKGVVQLSGFVKTTKEKTRAEAIAKEVEGVKKVINNIVVKAD
ncbi:BON domain-containing protein [Wolinella succinogenes]|uniref:BON domain-containing protein n=1 Tax=Wolinella succinogenes (strain ATCC 29543 / DSM 1740 / CCUG 13145 / JCM 31913 / LMG 7466 / NCTC 11488 / FDC 602W) TaxID=273121 RepID=Q7MR12_WOLSU|nr:BON domain-containing protein [Wolinella succinogenes]CAE10837.1 hypothetical protein WS1822 [Wolinella succinogenes]VEG80994.1 Osmotically-inducible protein Y precursor [Wolinella succinogenes]HCZ18510.1 BON domain-containing protein [Helicobacter sp.]